MNKEQVIGLFLLGLGLMSPAKSQTQEPPPLGYLIKCPESVQVVRKGVVLNVRSLFRLQVADELRAPAMAPVDLVHTGIWKQYHLLPGQVARVNPKGLWVVAATPPKPVRGKKTPKPQPLREAQVVRSVPQTAVSANTSRILGLVTRGVEVAPALSQPAPFGALEAIDGLKLTWINALTPEQIGTQKLVLSLRRDGEREAFREELLPGESTSFSVPPGVLLEGQLYFWEVTLPRTKLGPQKTGAPLWLLSEVERGVAAEARKTAALPPPTDSVASRLLADQLRALGLFSEALAALKEAQRRDPTNAAIPPAIAELEQTLAL